MVAQVAIFAATMTVAWAAGRTLRAARAERLAAEELVALADHYRHQAEQHHCDAQACVEEWIA